MLRYYEVVSKIEDALDDGPRNTSTLEADKPKAQEMDHHFVS